VFTFGLLKFWLIKALVGNMKRKEKLDKVLVIGGSGFLGSHVADALTYAGHDVTLLDLKKSEWINSKQSMVTYESKNFSLEYLLDSHSVVYHFAGVADIAEAKKNPISTFETNVISLMHVLEAVKKAKIRRFIYASTMYVYSDQGSFYRTSKQTAELIIETYAKEFGIDYTFLRYGSLYGPRSQKWNGINQFINQILERGVFEYTGTGQEMREYIHVEDAARLSVDILNEKFINTAVTITGQQLIEVEKLAAILFEILGKEKKLILHGKQSVSDHYGQTPYRYTPKQGRKLVPTEFIDLGQGLLELIHILDND
jgi:UDP-glucose 4-epimerase